MPCSASDSTVREETKKDVASKPAGDKPKDPAKRRPKGKANQPAA